jgi:hypothetical protein
MTVLAKKKVREGAKYNSFKEKLFHCLSKTLNS